MARHRFLLPYSWYGPGHTTFASLYGISFLLGRWSSDNDRSGCRAYIARTQERQKEDTLDPPQPPSCAITWRRMLSIRTVFKAELPANEVRAGLEALEKSAMIPLVSELRSGAATREDEHNK